MAVICRPGAQWASSEVSFMAMEAKNLMETASFSEASALGVAFGSSAAEPEGMGMKN